MNFFNKICSSKITTLVLMLLYATGLAVATLIEKYYGTPMAKANIYLSPMFFLLQFFMVCNYIAVVVRYELLLKKKWGLLLLHCSFIIILFGAFISHNYGEEGTLHLRKGETSDLIAVETIVSTQTVRYKMLPFTVELLDFKLHRYPGSQSPSSYESYLRVHVDGISSDHKVYMNNVLDVKGYRFFQASYDQDEQGTILSVNQDVAGRNVTYTGYFLLFLGFALSFFGKNSRFQTLNTLLRNSTKGIRPLLLFALFGLATLSTSSVYAQTIPQAIDATHAARFGALVIQLENGRMVPVNTFAAEVLRKLHKKNTIEGLNPDQFLLGVLSEPTLWGHIPFIQQTNKELTAMYQTADQHEVGKYCSYIDLFHPDGSYKLDKLVATAYSKAPKDRSKLDKDVLKLDEQINILHQLLNHQLLHIFACENGESPSALATVKDKWYAPGDDLSGFVGKDSMFVSQVFGWYMAEVKTASQTGDWTKASEVLGMIETYQNAKSGTLMIDADKLQMELRYNKWDIFTSCKRIYLIFGGLLLIVGFVNISRQSKRLNQLFWILSIGVFFCYLYHMLGMGIRWYIGGHAPWSNSYETMVYVSWATVTAGLFFMRKSAITFALASLFGGIILFVSSLNWMDPQIGTLVPVLQSPWLMFHVAVIVAAYGFFGISFLIGLTNLVIMSLGAAKQSDVADERLRKLHELSYINEMSLLIGLALMTIGTFLGAIWANESWGRYWGWDPKETWALITVIVYAIVIHLRLVKRLDHICLLNISSVWAFASVLMTFFGVNYLLSGMHSYGQSGELAGVFIYIYVVLALVLALSITAWVRHSR